MYLDLPRKVHEKSDLELTAAALVTDDFLVQLESFYTLASCWCP